MTAAAVWEREDSSERCLASRLRLRSRSAAMSYIVRCGERGIAKRVNLSEPILIGLLS